MEVDQVAQKAAMAELRKDREPTSCHRCGGKPGDPGCGKLIHLIMDGYYETAVRLLAAKEAANGTN